MPLHVAAFFESVDQTLDNVAALQDGIIPVQGDDLIVPDGMGFIAAVRVGSATAEFARLSTPSLRQLPSVALPDLQPVGALEPESPPAGFHEFWSQPLPINPAAPGKGERLNLLAENDGAGAAEPVYGIVFLSSGPVQPAPGPWTPVRATTAAAAVTADTWTARNITLAQTLPKGVYAVGGMRVQSTSLIAARLVFPGQSYRPGVLGCDADADIQPGIFRRGGLGELGRFTNDSPPQVELLCDAADNEVQEIVLDIKRVG